MFRLRTLGFVDLRDADDREVTAVLVQPKRLALLVYLAATATDAFVRRDLLLPLFWPELSDERARNALRQAVHQLRRSLGPEVVVSRGADALGVEGALLHCDVHAFERALARGALDDALVQYGGELLPGFAVDGAPAFERWLEETRASLRRRATRAAWMLAERRERAGDAEGAVEEARRAASLDADDEGAGTRLAAVVARAATPPASTRAIAGGEHAREAARVVVAPFQNLTGDAAFDFVGRLVCDAIARGVLESRTVEVVTADGADAAATASGLVVSGCYFLHGDAWRFEARIGAAGGRVLDTVGAVTAPRAQPWDAADELRRRLTGMLAGRLDPRFASWADAVAQAPDLDAHQELAIGVALHLDGDYRAALPHFLRAAAREGFTLPALWAVQASCNLREWEQAEAILAELTARGRHGRLSAFEQLGCDYYAATLDGRHGNALRIARAAAELVPDTEVLSQLGREAIFCNQPRAAAEALERLHPGRGWIPSWTPYWRRLTEAYHMLGEHARELEAARRGRMHHPEAMSALLYEARALAALGDVESVGRRADEACTLPADRFEDAGTLMLAAARELRAHGHEEAGLALASRAADWYRGPDAPHAGRPLARALYESGRWADARLVLEGTGAGWGDDVDAIGLAGAAAARAGDGEAARDALQRLRAKTGRFRFGGQHAWMARILAVLGEPEAAMAALHGAFARGHRHGIETHADVDLALLGDQAAFRELLKPRG